MSLGRLKRLRLIDLVTESTYVTFDNLRDHGYFYASSGILLLLNNFGSIADIFGALDE